MKMLLGDFSAKVGRKDIFNQSIITESSHDISNDNGVRIVNFAASKNIIAKTMVFQYHNIYKYTLTSLNGQTRSQIDHILIDKKKYRTNCAFGLYPSSGVSKN
jgi:hypothetical protein